MGILGGWVLTRVRGDSCRSGACECGAGGKCEWAGVLERLRNGSVDFLLRCRGFGRDGGLGAGLCGESGCWVVIFCRLF